ncbi:NADH-quinone oxidoreductase subunit M [Janibacter sp. YIM B02568]|uniref:NADH-quinone oxidoreductase subunit M n=1 Tax=Janibacter endophyticus TaxID=2806261 RepID=UPI00194FA2E1|nr:NADH-quinone oxidoreductase subunit M [Janibacter endophyticus]MBM6545473.1 NADH-quinone oxidoreductase subunit M [Janibacter endophyticus]
MTDFPWLTLLVVVPLVGAAVTAALPAALAKRFALGASVLTLALGIAAATQFSTGSGEQFQLAETYSWIPAFGVSWALGVDGISLALILMALVLAPVCILAAWNDVPEGGRRESTYFALLLSLVPFMVGVFAATDVFLFYVFFEAMLIPVYFLIGLYGGERRQYAAVKFLLYSLAGGLIMLVAVIALYVYGPGGADGFLVERLTGLELGQSRERWLFLGFFIAFAIKAPMWPVHTWLPDAAAESRPAVATMLVGVLDKVGTYGMIRFCLQMFPEASQWATPVVITLALVSILYGAVLAIGQSDLMRLIAFTSISHFGFIVLGIFALTSTAHAGSNLYMINHGFSTAALFLIAGMLIARRGSRRIDAYGGWQRVTPVLAGTFLIAGLSALALPGLSSFVSEFLVITGTFQRYPVAGAIASLGVVLAALYVMLMYKRIMTGPPPEIVEGAETVIGHDEGGQDLPYVRADLDDGVTPARIGPVRDLSWREKAVVAPLIASFLVIGFFPKPVLDVLDPAVERTLQYVGVTDPAPDAPADTAASTDGSNH